MQIFAAAAAGSDNDHHPSSPLLELVFGCTLLLICQQIRNISPKVSTPMLLSSVMWHPALKIVSAALERTSTPSFSTKGRESRGASFPGQNDIGRTDLRSIERAYSPGGVVSFGSHEK